MGPRPLPTDDADWARRIVRSPDAPNGRPVVRGASVAVDQVLRALAEGVTPTELVGAHPGLEPADVAACLAFAATLIAGPDPGGSDSVAAAAPPAVTLTQPVTADADTPAPAPPAGPGPHTPGYEVLGELGRGGMGVVYRARQVSLNRTVALKVIPAAAHASPARLARFRAEAEAVARLQHAGVVQVYEVGEHDGCPYIALEYVPGGSLAARLGGRPLPAGEAARLAEAMARAVHAVHEAGVVHRDLKPANVLLTADGQPKVADFSLARLVEDDRGLTRTGDILGTPEYMAPEQAGGTSAVGPAADVYALGAVLYELLTGRPPFRAATAWETIALLQEQEAVPVRRLAPRVPRDLETVCLKCLHKSPRHRYACAADLADDLRRFRDGEPVLARPLGLWGRVDRRLRRLPEFSAYGLLLAVPAALVVLVLLLVGQWREALADAAAVAAFAATLRADLRWFGVGAAVGVALVALAAPWLGGDVPAGVAAGLAMPLMLGGAAGVVRRHGWRAWEPYFAPAPLLVAAGLPAPDAWTTLGGTSAAVAIACGYGAVVRLVTWYFRGNRWLATLGGLAGAFIGLILAVVVLMVATTQSRKGGELAPAMFLLVVVLGALIGVVVGAQQRPRRG